MRGRKTAQTNFLCTLNIESRIPERHPIREVKKLVNEVLAGMNEHFEDLYAEDGRDSTPPERIPGAKVLMALHNARSERQFCERLQYDLLFQWFLDINPDKSHACFGGFRKSRYRGIERTGACAQIVGAAYNLVRMAKLVMSGPPRGSWRISAESGALRPNPAARARHGAETPRNPTATACPTTKNHRF